MEETIELLTVEEVMKVLRISRPTLYRMLKSSKLQPVKIGKRTLFEMKDIRSLVERSKMPAAQAEQEQKKQVKRGRKPKEQPATIEAQVNVDAPVKKETKPLGRQILEQQKQRIEEDKQGRLL